MTLAHPHRSTSLVELASSDGQLATMIGTRQPWFLTTECTTAAAGESLQSLSPGRPVRSPPPSICYVLDPLTGHRPCINVIFSSRV